MSTVQKVGRRGARLIASALRCNKVLTGLNIRGNDVQDKGAIALAEAIKSNAATALAVLDIGYNKIGWQGAQAVADALKTNNSLTALSLACASLMKQPPTGSYM
eukprot:Unigene11367_Nuclearia_a/m.34687 Unigene11367_Nuclearia_a/g.34687  ORF Unigene11367_Nuclearia_a/g.34687 Unigene11367_Nuclearia_a/m.34687 type:complete len:104 (+) Unigene11367_Nuclearia_a:320-631(+)